MLSSQDDLIFSAVDEEGRIVLCRAVLCFEREGKFFLLYVPQDETLGLHSLRAGYCDADDLLGSQTQLRPVREAEHWRWIDEALSQQLGIGEEEPALFFDEGDGYDDDLFEGDETGGFVS